MLVVLISTRREEKEGAEFFHLRTEPTNLFPLLFPSVLQKVPAVLKSLLYCAPFQE
jgi:hypothetical protein